MLVILLTSTGIVPITLAIATTVEKRAIHSHTNRTVEIEVEVKAANLVGIDFLDLNLLLGIKELVDFRIIIGVLLFGIPETGAVGEAIAAAIEIEVAVRRSL